MAFLDFIPMDLITNNLMGINFFAIFWYSVTFVVGSLGAFIYLNEKILPETLVSVYKFGKLNLSNDANKRSQTPRRRKETLLGFGVSKIITLVSVQVSKSWFQFFYIFGALINIFFFGVHNFLSADQIKLGQIFICFIFGRSDWDADWKTTNAPSLLFILITIHLIRRIIETRYISIYSRDAKMSIVHFLSGIAFYASLALACHNLDIDANQDAKIGANSLSFTSKTIGVAVFFLGQAIQFDAHKNLASLRLASGNGDKHFMPRGRLFNYISCPNYLGEIFIYIGLLIISNSDTAMMSLTVWVIVNQIIAGLLSHKWYQQNFGDYPRERKAIIPFFL